MIDSGDPRDRADFDPVEPVVDAFAELERTGRNARIKRRKAAGAAEPAPFDGHRPFDRPVIVLWEDDDIIAVDKPAGLVVVPERFEPSPDTLTNAVWHLLWTRAGADPADTEASRPRLIHRLDREASGVMLFAKTLRGQRDLTEQFAGRHVDKVYHTLVDGEVVFDDVVLDYRIGRHPRPNHSNRGKMFVNVPDAAEAVTELKTLERLGPVTAMEARPVTGRTHQIRVHLAAWGHPLVVDPLYGRRTAFTLRDLTGTAPLGKADPVLLARMPLHCVRIAFTPPTADGPVTVEAPLPGEIARFVDRLRLERAG